jgi:quercetin dioxygenase-like cupin family protein
MGMARFFSILYVALFFIIFHEQARTQSIEVLPILTTTKSWPGSLLPGFRSGQTEFKVWKFKLEPGTSTAIHMHPLNGAGYIISGELTIYATEDPNGSFDNVRKVKKIKRVAGDSWAEPVNVWHYGVNEGKTNLEFTVVFVGEEGTPPTVTLGTYPSKSSK